ncbi:MAG: PstS family phosphate ABC transporter substrate-binding protein [Clostridia bacterium]
MRKFIGYIPAVLFTAFCVYAPMTGVRLTLPMALIWIACFWLSATFLHKGLFWGGAFGLFPAIHMIYMGTQYTEQVVNIEIPLGIILLLFYGIFGFYLWKKRNDIPKPENKEIIIMVVKVALTIGTIVASAYVAVFSALILTLEGINPIILFITVLVLPSLLLPLIWLKKRKKFFLIWLIPACIYFISLGINYGMIKYDESITINTSPNINVHEYLPFKEDSKIVKYDSKTLKLTSNLPRIDGAAALFPVYSAFVNAVYPETTELNDGTFEYNNTPGGYKLLAEKQTDIFIGVYPSDEQKAYAEECNTTFEYTPIGTEAFVFFVHKDNPIENLTTEQIKSIYAGEITNWKELGGRNEEIAPFQRNKGSGSQSMLERFMGDKPIMEAPTELKNDLMSGIIEQVSNYRNKSNSIGFSFRFYVEGIIKNPDIKMISIDGIKPTAENIRNGKYPVVTPIYAVTYEEETNENVDKLLDWILSEEGQYIIEETGYVGVISDFTK